MMNTKKQFVLRAMLGLAAGGLIATGVVSAEMHFSASAEYDATIEQLTKIKDFDALNKIVDERGALTTGDGSATAVLQWVADNKTDNAGEAAIVEETLWRAYVCKAVMEWIPEYFCDKDYSGDVDKGTIFAAIKGYIASSVINDYTKEWEGEKLKITHDEQAFVLDCSGTMTAMISAVAVKVVLAHNFLRKMYESIEHHTIGDVLYLKFKLGADDDAISVAQYITGAESDIFALINSNWQNFLVETQAALGALRSHGITTTAGGTQVKALLTTWLADAKADATSRVCLTLDDLDV